MRWGSSRQGEIAASDLGGLNEEPVARFGLKEDAKAEVESSVEGTGRSDGHHPIGTDP